MFKGERYSYNESGRRLFDEYVGGRVKIFTYENGMRATEIDCAGMKILVVREAIPQIIPDNYGRIIVQDKKVEAIFPIKQAVRDHPVYFIEEITGMPGVLGSVEGPKLDLALAYSLGISDEYLATAIQTTRMQPGIPERIADIIFH